MDTKSFNERNFDKPRAVCEGIEREDGGSCVVLTDRERQILDIWPKFEDGEYVWFGDVVKFPTCGAISAEAIEFTAGKVQVKDAEDGDWNTSMCAIHPLKRPAPKVLDADGVEIKVGDTVWWKHEPTEYTVKDVIEGAVYFSHLGSIGNECVTTTLTHHLTHTRPDSWERLEEDAAKDECDYFGFSDTECTEGDGCPACDDSPDCHRAKIRDLVRRAKALAGVEE